MEREIRSHNNALYIISKLSNCGLQEIMGIKIIVRKYLDGTIFKSIIMDNHFKGTHDQFIDRCCENKNENNEIEIAFSHYNNIEQCNADFERRGFKEVKRREEKGIYYVTFKQK